MKYRKKGIKLLNIAICDDDLVFASGVETLLLKVSNEKFIDMNIEVYADGSELWSDILSGEKFDIIYLDIEMVKINGIDVAKLIREKDNNVILIYVSNYENYFIELFEVEPFRFIKKPIDKMIFANYFTKAYERILKEELFFEYKFNKVPHKELTKNIMYFESTGRMITMHSIKEEGKFYGKLNLIERQLSTGKIPFLRIHQSFLVNYRFIKEISFFKVVLVDGTELQISEDRQKVIRAKYNELIGGEFFD